MKLKNNGRGFKVGSFLDIYGIECSIQESSLADKNALWLGCDKGNHHMGECLARMHIDKKIAKELVKHLSKFIKTGRL